MQIVESNDSVPLQLFFAFTLIQPLVKVDEIDTDIDKPLLFEVKITPEGKNQIMFSKLNVLDAIEKLAEVAVGFMRTGPLITPKLTPVKTSHGGKIGLEKALKKLKQLSTIYK
jgi:hypothetical protein